MHFTKRFLSIISVLSVMVCLPSCEEMDLPIGNKQDIVFFSDEVTFDGGRFENYKPDEPGYSIQPSCFEVIGGKWYALEYKAYRSWTDVNLLVNGEKKATILKGCLSVQNAVAYVQNGRFKAYIFYFDADDNYHGIHYDDGKTEEIEGLTDFERILMVRTVKNDVYAVWNLDVHNFYEVGNIVITKNDKPVEQSLTLPAGTSVWYFRDLFIDGSTIYSFLTLHKDGINKAYYAKDNELVRMNGLEDVCCGQVVGSKVYGLGIVHDDDQKSRYWEDGKTTKILPESAPVSPRGLAVDKGSVYYLVTDYSSRPCTSVLFKDGVEYTRQEKELTGFKIIH